MLLVRYFAGARAAAGTSEEKLDAQTLDALIETATALHGDRLAGILTSCSFLVDGLNWRDRTAPLPAEATVDVLPPFAGG
jgi:molybdopterin converting factor small subunit